jgi:hypothetical protein
MDKNEAFEIIVNVVSQVNSFNIVQARTVDEAIQVLAKEIKYAAKEQVEEPEDLEKSIRKQK